MLWLVVHLLIICVFGVILFRLIDKFVWNLPLASLLKILVVLICLASLLHGCSRYCA
jgi:hypothetical protein